MNVFSCHHRKWKPDIKGRSLIFLVNHFVPWVSVIIKNGSWDLQRILACCPNPYAEFIKIVPVLCTSFTKYFEHSGKVMSVCLSVCPSVCTLHLQHYSSDMDWIYCSFPWVATAGIHWTTSAFGGDPRRMLIAIQSFIFHLQGEHVLVVSGNLPYIILPKTTSQCMLILKVTTAVFAETLDKFQHWTLFVSESQRCALNLSLNAYTKSSNVNNFGPYG
jgi:hypothetical protein